MTNTTNERVAICHNGPGSGGRGVIRYLPAKADGTKAQEAALAKARRDYPDRKVWAALLPDQGDDR